MNSKNKLKLTGKAVLVDVSQVYAETRARVHDFLINCGYVRTQTSKYLYHFEVLQEEENRISTFKNFKGYFSAFFTNHPTKIIHKVNVTGAL